MQFTLGWNMTEMSLCGKFTDQRIEHNELFILEPWYLNRKKSQSKMKNEWEFRETESTCSSLFCEKKKCKRSLQKSSEAMSCNISNCNYNPNYNKIIVKRICSNQITAISNRNEGQGRKVTFQDCLSLTFLRRSHILGVVFGYKKRLLNTWRFIIPV